MLSVDMLAKGFAILISMTEQHGFQTHPHCFVTAESDAPLETVLYLGGFFHDRGIEYNSNVGGTHRVADK